MVNAVELRDSLAYTMYKEKWSQLRPEQQEELRRQFYLKCHYGLEELLFYVSTEEGQDELNLQIQRAQMYMDETECFEYYLELCQKHEFIPQNRTSYLSYIARVLLDENRLQTRSQISKKQTGDGKILYILNQRDNDCLLLVVDFEEEGMIIFNAYVSSGTME